jgi:hypothetical protein
LAAPLSQHDAVLLTGGAGELTIAFAEQDYDTTDLHPPLISAADHVEVDAEALTYLIGEPVYATELNPNDPVNKTSGAGRKQIGRVAVDTDLSGGAGKLLIDFDGRS